MKDVTVGARVQVRPAYDETLRLLGMRTGPGTITAVYDEPGGPVVVVELDDGQAVPYPPHELAPVAGAPDRGAAENAL